MLDTQAKIADRVRDGIGIAKRYIFKIDSALRRGQHHSVWRILDCGLGIKNGKNLGGRSDRLLHHDVDLAERFDRIVEEEDSCDQPKEHAGTEVRGVNVKQYQP